MRREADIGEAESARRPDPIRGDPVQDADAALARAAEMLAAGKPSKAAREYAKAEKQSPLDERALCGMALMCMWRSSQHKLKEYAEKLRAARPGAAYPHGLLGMNWEEWGVRDAALECYDRVLAADPGEVSAYVRKAIIFHYEGMEKECAETIQECLDASWSGRESPKERRRLREMGRSIKKNGRVAFKALDSAMFFPGLWEMLDVVLGPDRGSPGAPDAELDFEGIRLAGEGDLQGCLEWIERAIKSRPRSAIPWCMKGALLAEDGRAGEAVTCYERAAEIDPDEATAYSGKAALLADEGDRDGAIACIGEELSGWLLDDRSDGTHKDLARAYWNMRSDGRWPPARSLRAAYGLMRWAAGRRAKAQSSPGGRRAGGAGPLFPPGLVDGAARPDRAHA